VPQKDQHIGSAVYKHTNVFQIIHVWNKSLI